MSNPIHSIRDLEGLLKGLDSTASKDTRLEGVAFEQTYNESLGLPGQTPDYLVFIPWRKWPGDPLPQGTHYPSALQEAFKDVLKHGADPKTCFIDIITLNPHAEFFNEPGTTECVADAIADAIDQTDESVTPVIRFLAGTEDNKTAETVWNENKAKFEAIFWRDGKPLVKKNKHARLYVGYYSPNFKIG